MLAACRGAFEFNGRGIVVTGAKCLLATRKNSVPPIKTIIERLQCQSLAVGQRFSTCWDVMSQIFSSFALKISYSLRLEAEHIFFLRKLI